MWPLRISSGGLRRLPAPKRGTAVSRPAKKPRKYRESHGNSEDMVSELFPGIETGLLEVQTAESASVVILPPSDVLDTLERVKGRVTATILDPWYNKGVGGTRPDYHTWLSEVLEAACRVSSHVFLWGFPEIVARCLDYIPAGCELVAWLTWYYKNCPSVIRGWRSAQLACLHIGHHGARIYPEHFLNGAQLERQREGKLRYMPGPPSVIEASLIVGFVGRSEKTGHPAQKPVAAIEPLIKMSTQPGDIILDPMCGSGTTGVAARNLDRRAILCDISEDYTRMAEKRLGMERVTCSEGIDPSQLFVTESGEKFRVTI
ncbi:MAG: site-specific DNA-methyltransferase [Planctomycetes bacterium]|nr:site-specific DNA-methyltransferase [Planctomycetota bacterium]